MKKNPISIHTGTEKQLKPLFQLVKALALYEKEPDAVTATLADYQRDFENNVFRFLYAQDETGKVLGITLFFIGYSTWKGKMLFLDDFVVDETARGHGIGQLLFDSLIDLAKAENVKLVKWQVLDWNTPALRFYERQQANIETNWYNGKIELP